MKEKNGHFVGPLAVLVCLLLCIPPASLGEECRDSGQWKNIYVVPTNPNPDRNIKVTLNVDKSTVKPGDTVTVTFTADKDCYLTLMDVGTSEKIIRLWPNDFSGVDNFVRAGEVRRFPAAGDRFEYVISGPSGVENIVAYATSQKDRILTEGEFSRLKDTGFKEFRGVPKDLDLKFREGTAASDGELSWGTAQVNLCITDPPPPATSDPSRSTSGGAGSASEPSGESVLSKGQTYVLALGVPTEGLRYCDRDAFRFADAMRSRLGVQRPNIKLVIGQKADYQGFEDGLRWLADRSQPEDSVVVFFSGHGSFVPDQAPLDEQDGSDECFVLYHKGVIRDYQMAISQKLVMRDDEFNALLKRIPARKKIVIVDACHSGTISKRPGAGPDGSQQEPERFVSKFYPLRIPGADVEDPVMRLKSKAVPTDYGTDHEATMSACLDNESSYEDSVRKSGLFTFHLLEAIEKGSRDLEEAFERAKRVTKDESTVWARQLKAGPQTPSLTDPHGFVRLFNLLPGR